MRNRLGVGITVALFGAIMNIAPAGAITVGGNIESDTTWTAAEEITVTSDILITVTGHLTIEAGTAVHFTPGIGMTVEGQLTASGANDNRIVFTSTADTLYGSPAAGNWTGISFQNTGTGTLYGCDVRYATNGIAITVTSPLVKACTITNFLSSGVNISAGAAIVRITPLIDSCIIGQSLTGLRGTGKGLYAYVKADLTITNSVIHDCLFGLEFYSATSNVPGFEITDCTIIGNAARGIYTHPG